MAIEAQVALRGGKADQHRRIDGGGQHRWPEDAGYVEPPVIRPDALTGKDPVDPETLRSSGTEDCDGLLGGRRVEVAALSDAGPHRTGQAEAGRLDGEGVGVD